MMSKFIQKGRENSHKMGKKAKTNVIFNDTQTTYEKTRAQN